MGSKPSVVEPVDPFQRCELDGFEAAPRPASPWRASGELISRLLVEYPGAYPNKLLRTLQRRLKSWRSEHANALLFAPGEKMPTGIMTCETPEEEAGRSETPAISASGLLLNPS